MFTGIDEIGRTCVASVVQCVPLGQRQRCIYACVVTYLVCERERERQRERDGERERERERDREIERRRDGEREEGTSMGKHERKNEQMFRTTERHREQYCINCEARQRDCTI